MAKKKYKFVVPWRETWYAPIQMQYGTVQSHYIRRCAKYCWEDFCRATGQTKTELLKRGYRVKRLKLILDNK